MPQCGRPSQLAHHRLDLAERRLVRHALEHVHGDVRGLAPVRGREQRVVAGREAQLDRERDRDGARGSRARARTASAARARGSAYSISSKRTSRGLAKTSKDSATRSRLEAARPASRLMRRDRPRRAPRGAVEQPERVVVQHHVLQPLAAAAAAASRGASVRLLVRVSASGECGNVNSSKWSLASTCASSPSSTSSSGSGRSTAWRRKAGTQRRVTAATTPSAPSPTRAARSSSPPSTVSSRAVGRARAPSPRRSRARLPSRAPVPCVPVTSAPASDWASMSPRFGSARPWRVQLAHEPVQRDAGLGAHEPGRAVDVEHAVEPLERQQRPVGRHAGRERVPGARHAAPRARARRPRPARARLPGRTCSAGAHDCPRDQFDHMPARLPPHELGARARGAAPARGARPRDGRRGAGGAPARRRAG